MAAPYGATTYFNRQGCEYTGCPREANDSWGWMALLHPNDAEPARPAWEHVVRTEDPFTIEFRIRRFDGAFRWNCVRALATARCQWGTHDLDRYRQRHRRPAATGTVAMGLGTESDRNPRHPSTDRVGCSLGGSVSSTGTFVSSTSTRASLGWAASRSTSISGAPWLNWRPPCGAEFENAYQRALSGTAVINLEVTGPSAEQPGQTLHWLTSNYPVRVDGEIIGVSNLIVDITERKEDEDFRAAVMDNMAEGLITVDGDGCVKYMNHAATNLIGWSEDELRGKPMHGAVHFQQADGTLCPDEDCPMLKVGSEGVDVRVADETFTRKDGTTFPVAYSSRRPCAGGAIRGAVVVFRDVTDELGETAQAMLELTKLSWVGRIRDALDDGRFVLYSQAIVPLGDRKPSEELLLRMIGPSGNVILPGSFLPVAEKYGLIGEIDRWVITEAVGLAATGRRVEVNLSAASVNTPDMLTFIERKIHEAGADPRNIVFEITETALMHDIDAGASFVRRLVDLGCRFALDDFGTGFGSFTYLKRLHVDYLKIDIDFVRDLTTNSANLHLVKAVVALAHGFGAQTIAEGVEDEETLTLLRIEQVDFAQGFHVGRPAPLVPIRDRPEWSSPR